MFICRSDTESFFLKKEKEEREKREGGGDNRSFLQKYVSLESAHSQINVTAQKVAVQKCLFKAGGWHSAHHLFVPSIIRTCVSVVRCSGCTSW